jgi:hypothetical protein
VRAVNAAYRAEGEWISKNPREAEVLVQKDAGYSDAVRDSLIKLARWEFHGTDDAKFIATFQGAADWLAARKILPQKVQVSDYIVKVSFTAFLRRASMSINFIGMVTTHKNSEIHPRSGRPSIPTTCCALRAHEEAGFDRILVPYHQRPGCHPHHRASGCGHAAHQLMLAHRPASWRPRWRPASWPR